MRPAPQIAVDFIAKHEAFKPCAYKPTKNDVWTIGYGHTLGVKEGDTCTMEQAKRLLAIDLDTAGARLAIVIPHAVDGLTDNQYAALLSFVFNAGAGDWDIWKKINTNRIEDVPTEMRRFVHQGKRRMPGLVQRREDEIALFNS